MATTKSKPNVKKENKGKKEHTKQKFKKRFDIKYSWMVNITKIHMKARENKNLASKSTSALTAWRRELA